MIDHRIQPIMLAVSQKLEVNLEWIETILKIADDADREAGIVRVSIIPNEKQIITGMRCALHGESPGKTYEQMVKIGQK